MLFSAFEEIDALYIIISNIFIKEQIIMKRMGLIIFNIFMSIVILFGLIFGMQVSMQQINLNKSNLLAEMLIRNLILLRRQIIRKRGLVKQQILN